MKSMKWIYSVLLASMIITSCTSDTGKTAGSFDLEFYTNESGAKPQSGQYAYFQMDILDDKKELLQSYRSNARMPHLKIPESNSPVLKQNPIPDALRQMAINDSVAIIIPKDSIPDLAEGYEGITHLEYVLVLKEILNEADYKNRLAVEREAEIAQMSANKAKLPQIEELAKQTIKDVKAGKIKPTYTESGLGYIIHEKGEGDLPTKDRMITAQYYGALMADSKPFDNSFKRGQPFNFRVGRGSVIRGWDEGFLYLPVGSKASFIIPSELGYGSAGSPPSIPADSDLYFYVELEEMFY